MISFIIIGRNEGWKLSKCFVGIEDLVNFGQLEEFETIYIDSDSNDNSIDIMKEHNVNIIIKITGNVNAAIARNVGANAASGSVLFFMDGDIELKPFDIKLILNDDYSLKFGYVVGFLDDVNYTSDWIYINQTPRSYKTVKSDLTVTTVGSGIFIIEKRAWSKFGGMDERLKRTEDRDLSLRMAKSGITGIRISEVLGLQHTIPYKDKKRMWRMLFDGSINYKGVMIRKHILNPSYWPILIREEWTMIVLIVSFLLMFKSYLFLSVYLIACIIKNRKRLIKENNSLFVIANRILMDISTFLSILFFYPKSPIFKVIRIP
ncbi:MAG: glycosyltransferase [Desulfobacula sp.]|nr:glycosyltransferase [Desulfobacula sp.]